MTLDDQRLLMRFARLMLEISIAQAPAGTIMDITEKTVTRSKGYKDLRRFFLALSRKKRDNFRKSMHAQVSAIDKLIADAKAKGETVDLGSLTIEVRDAETGAPITGDELPRMEAANDSDGDPVVGEPEPGATT